MNLAIFDLDNTLLGGDSDHSWGEFLIAKNLVPPLEYKKQNDQFYEDYKNGNLNMLAYQEFALAPLARFSMLQLRELHNAFMEEVISPMRLPKADALIEKHRQLGDELLIITATNRFITQPIAEALGITNLLATEAEIVNETYTGNVLGEPCYKDGKITRLNTWLAAQKMQPAHTCFYSDSANDIPLLSQVDEAIAVDPDEKLKAHAQENNWRIISLR